MGLWEVSLRASYNYPFIALSRVIPDVPLSMWCLWNRELLQLPTRDPRLISNVEKAIRKAGHVVDEWVDADSARLWLLECTCSRYDSIWNLLEANRCWDAPPVVYRDGWAHVRAVSFGQDHTRGLFRDLQRRGPAQLVRKRELPLSVLPTSVWSSSLFGGMTRRQMDAVLAAHRFGYYSSPREAKTEEIASSLGLSRTTYEEHLRKGENRLMAALIPHLRLFATSDHPPGTNPGEARSES